MYFGYAEMQECVADISHRLVMGKCLNYISNETNESIQIKCLSNIWWSYIIYILCALLIYRFVVMLNVSVLVFKVCVC